MRLIRCDRCGRTLETTARHSVVSVFDVDRDVVDLDVLPSQGRQLDLCPTCRSAFDTFMSNGPLQRRAAVAKVVAAQPVPAPGSVPGRADTASPPPAATPPEPASVDSINGEAPVRTCQRCGRIGTRQFVYNPPSKGWLCKRGDACEARRAARKGIPTLTPRPDAPRKKPEPEPEPESVDLDAAPPAPAAPPPTIPAVPITARCQDCTRTWTLTGRVLQTAAEMHEQKHSHIVTILEASA